MKKKFKDYKQPRQLTKINYLKNISNSKKSFIIYKSPNGFDLYTDFSKKVVLTNKNIEKLANNFKDKKICALCAIGNPERFFKTLSSLGFKDFVKIALPDHKALSEPELLKISADFDYVFMTQKDAIKYQDMAGVLESEKFWVVGVDAVCEDGFFNAVMQKLPF
mgnify:CR=1 FL=1